MEYEISLDTQAIVQINDKSTKIIESGEEFIINDNIMNVMEHSCEYFGSSFEGRKDGTKRILGITHKVPIIIEESRKIIFFPTTSPERDDCVWINLNRIDKYNKNEKGSEIVFKDGTKFELNVSIGSLTNQIMRATRLKYILDERISQKEDII